MSISIDIQGITQLAAKINGVDIDGISKTLVTKAAIWGENKGKERSPVDEGRLKNSINHRVDSPRQARYGTNVPYGLYLDQPKTRTPHYIGGPHGGAETAGWLSKTDTLVETYIGSVLIPEAVRKLESSW